MEADYGTAQGMVMALEPVRAGLIPSLGGWTHGLTELDDECGLPVEGHRARLAEVQCSVYFEGKKKLQDLGIS
ncbi:hypothetical protein NDU88_001096 [Pleurodeles waltl]|uniref:Uncharacterized protein n=1 Tax=Pleurodeles waltl TaxID=8319 RepID=A0AAV7WN97_PLEWA|nr:hypothetical protein NDU88_001096 [Pleurodeles waltl]